MIRTLGEALRRHELERGDEIMTYAEELLAEGWVQGLIEGEQRGKMEVVEGLLRIGVS